MATYIESCLGIKLSKFSTVISSGVRRDRNGSADLQLRLPFYEAEMAK